MTPRAGVPSVAPATPDRRRRRRRRLVLLALCVVFVLIVVGGWPVLWAKLNLGQAAVDAATAAARDPKPFDHPGGDGPDDATYLAGKVARDDLPDMCSSLEVQPDTGALHPGGTVTVRITCRVDVPPWSWIGIDPVVLTSSATAAVPAAGR